MRKQFYFLFVSAMLAGSAHAQIIIAWGYPQGDGIANYALSYQSETIAYAMKVDGRVLKGGQLTGLKLCLPAAKNLTDIHVWASSTLPKDLKTFGDLADVTPNKAVLKEGVPSVVDFESPVSLNGSTVYVGCTFTQARISDDADNYPIYCYKNSKAMPGAFYLQTSASFPEAWYDGNEVGFPNVAMDALVDINNLSAQPKVQAEPLGETTTMIGDSVKYVLTLNNNGYYVTDFDLSGQCATSTLNSHVQLPTPLTRMGDKATYTVAFKAPEKAQATPVEYAITRINGTENAYPAQAKGTGEIIGIDRPTQRRTLMEAFTNCDCPFEVTAMAGTSILKDSLGRRFIAINNHRTVDSYYDLLNCADYDEPTAALVKDKLPVYWLDRHETFDPYLGHDGADSIGHYHFGAAKVARKAIERPAEADITLKAAWTDAQQSAISATVSTSFAYNRNDAPYAIAFVLTEDSVSYKKGYQVNALDSWYYDEKGHVPMWGDKFADDDLKQYRTQHQDYIDGVVNNNVTRAAWSPLTGIDTSIKAPIKSGETQTFTQTLQLDGKEILDKSKLKLVAMLINRKDSSIVNADEVSMSISTGIHSAVSAATKVPVSWYSMDGCLISAPRHGISIMRTATGKVVKVLRP